MAGDRTPDILLKGPKYLPPVPHYIVTEVLYFIGVCCGRRTEYTILIMTLTLNGSKG